ncbi:MAG: radical SAM protein, partial [Deltaproteobacteria bacterium]|nr:radical SAM protein [Deltaproteobacteria bacterium]
MDGMRERAMSLRRQGLPVLKLGARRALGRKSPFQVSFSVTNRCNFKCVYCDIPLQKRDEMDFGEWRDAIDELRAAGMGRASLIGGEPLIHDDIGAIIGHLKRRDVHTAMNTNGWLVDERIDDVRRLDLVCITLDGPAAVHDVQRRAGSYDKVIEALGVLRRVNVPAVTMSVVTPAGAETMDHVLEVAEEHGHKAFFQLEHDKSCDVAAAIAPRISNQGVADVAARLIDAKRAGRPVGNSFAILEAQRQRRYLGGCDTCYAGRYYAYVLSDGTIAPCLLTQWQQETGNGRQLGFARAFQEMTAPTGPGCSCVPTHEVNR